MSSKVTLGPDSVEDTQDGTITTQGRWRKRARRTPKALDKDPKPKTPHHDPSATPSVSSAITSFGAIGTNKTTGSLAESSGNAGVRSLGIKPRDMNAFGHLTSVAPTDAKSLAKQVLFRDIDDNTNNNKNNKNNKNNNAESKRKGYPQQVVYWNGTKQVVAATRTPMTVETLSRVISVLENSGNVAMLDFATPLTLSASAAVAKTQSPNMLPGVASWSMAMGLGSPMAQHVSSEAAWREQLFPMFLRYHLPHELISGCKTTTRTLRSRNWLLNLTDASLDGAPALETAMTALCMARVGRHTKNSTLVQHSLGLYTKGLRQLQDAIHDPSTQLTDQTLAACMAFSMYEVSECPSRHLNGYYSHHMGGLALLKMRGPDAHISPLGHSLFVFMRLQQFVYGLLTRRANFLCEPDWTSTPWQTSAKDPQDKFMDQMYCIPVLLEQTDGLEAASPTMSVDDLVRGYWDIIGQYHAIYQCLLVWHKDLQSIVAGPLYWPELSTLPCPIFDGTSQGRPFAVAFHFPAFAIGQSVVLFWLISMMVNQQMHSLYERLIKIYPRSSYHTTSVARNSTPPLHPGDVHTAQTSTTAAAATASGWSESRSPDTTPIPSIESPASSSSASDSDSATSSSPATISSVNMISDSSASPSSSTTADSAAAAAAAAASAVSLPSIPVMKAAAEEAIAITRTSAANVCQSVEYFLQDNMGDVGPMSMMLPLTTLRHVLCHLEPIRPCPPGSPGRPGENSDDVVWTDYLIRYIGGRGQRLAFHLDHT